MHKSEPPGIFVWGIDAGIACQERHTLHVLDGALLVNSKEHMQHMILDVLPTAGPTYLAMAMVRRVFGRRAGCVRCIQRKHLQLTGKRPRIFLPGQKRHEGEWRNLNDTPDLLKFFKKAGEDGIAYTKKGPMVTLQSRCVFRVLLHV